MSALDKVKDLPEDAEDPFMFKLESNTLTPVIDVVLAGSLPEKDMQNLAEDLQDEIESIEHVLEVSVAGVRDREIWVEVDPDRLGFRVLIEGLQRVIAAAIA